RLRRAVDALLRGEAGAQAHHLPHRVERVDLPVHHAADLQVEAVGPEVDGGKGVVARHCTATLARRAPGFAGFVTGIFQSTGSAAHAGSNDKMSPSLQSANRTP